MLTVMREHFTDGELDELVAFMGFMWAGGTFGKIFGVQPKEHFSGWRPKRYPGLLGPKLSSRVIHPILGKICGVLSLPPVLQRLVAA